eukprot:TRINITY_DN65735_c0_g1_i1.p1 TRINITY_DN65735_c0_g1~~TRINITY_DN65735_c0_g1_i1.p1  ORF type:complete len:368 (+),score=102.89 TRINITY_DN65735_c0_g1_i1:74-1105(+)
MVVRQGWILGLLWGASGQPVLTPDFLAEVQRRAALAGWTAAPTLDPELENATLQELRTRLGGAWRQPAGQLPPRPPHPDDASAVPDQFDARQHWPHCKTISRVPDQSACNSDWAVAAASAMSDRVCVSFGSSDTRARDVRVSAAHLLTCCQFVPIGACGLGCIGGNSGPAWEYWTLSGIVTEQCVQYPFPSCKHPGGKGSLSPCRNDSYPTPACPRTCSSGEALSSQRTTGNTSYYVSGEEGFKRELRQRGPFEVSLTVYADFLTYRSGVFQHVAGAEIKTQSVRLIGWGNDFLTGNAYWLLVNSWNTQWGDGGYFKILRGVNECGIESRGVAGLPSSYPTTR